MSQGHSTRDSHTPAAPVRGSCSVGGASCSQSFVLNQQIGLPCLAAHIPASHWAAGAWPSTATGGAGPIESCPTSAGSSRTNSLGTLERHRCYSTALFFCSSPGDLVLSCHRKCPFLCDSASSLPVGGVLPGLCVTSVDSSSCGASCSGCVVL